LNKAGTIRYEHFRGVVCSWFQLSQLYHPTLKQKFNISPSKYLTLKKRGGISKTYHLADERVTESRKKMPGKVEFKHSEQEITQLCHLNSLVSFNFIV
jgi:hypothetical protein